MTHKIFRVLTGGERVPPPKGSFAFVELIIHMTYKVGAHYDQLLAPVQ